MCEYSIGENGYAVTAGVTANVKVGTSVMADEYS